MPRKKHANQYDHHPVPPVPTHPDRTHRVNRTLTVDLLFPNHDPRTESPEHRHVRQELIVERKEPCWICGRTIDDLDESQLEIHHLYAEYSMYLDIDPSRVNADHPVFAPYNQEGVYQDADSLNGSLVLCALHHRGSDQPGRALEEGIHNADFDSWAMQKYVQDTDLHVFIPGVVLVRKGVSDEHGYLASFLQNHPELKETA